jgi:hypothetical protein
MVFKGGGNFTVLVIVCSRASDSELDQMIKKIINGGLFWEFRHLRRSWNKSARLEVGCYAKRENKAQIALQQAWEKG